MKKIAQGADGRSWFEIETQADADEETARMRHAVKVYFAYSKSNGNEAERFFSLRDAGGNPFSTCMTRGERIALAVAEANACPWPEFGADYESLAETLGVELDRDAAYPYNKDHAGPGA